MLDFTRLPPQGHNCKLWVPTEWISHRWSLVAIPNWQCRSHKRLRFNDLTRKSFPKFRPKFTDLWWSGRWWESFRRFWYICFRSPMLDPRSGDYLLHHATPLCEDGWWTRTKKQCGLLGIAWRPLCFISHLHLISCWMWNSFKNW